MGSDINDSGKRTYAAASAITAGLRVKISGSSGGKNTIATAGIAEAGIGIAMNTAAVAGDLVTVRMWSHPGTHQIITGAPVALGAALYCIAGGKFSSTSAGAGVQWGVAEQASTADLAIIEGSIKSPAGS